MNFNKISIIALSLIAVANTPYISSQTCKVRTSLSNNGGCQYTEVYEYDYVDEKPEFPGGSNKMISFINSTREYPLEAYEMGIEGRVTCSFIVEENGKISHIQVLKGVENSLNNEAMRIVAMMPDWTPGKINDQRVPVRVVACIPFRK